MHHRYETAVYEAVRGRGGSWRSCSAHSQRRGRSLGRERYSWGDTRRRRHPDGGRDEASSLFINVGRRGCAAGSFRHYYESARKPLSLLLPFPLLARERERDRSRSRWIGNWVEIEADRNNPFLAGFPTGGLLVLLFGGYFSPGGGRGWN